MQIFEDLEWNQNTTCRYNARRYCSVALAACATVVVGGESAISRERCGGGGAGP